MTINIENNVFAEIGAGLTSGTLLLNIKGGKHTLFPPAPFTLNLVKFNSTGTVLQREIVNVTGKAGNIFTITRAYEPVPVNDAALTTVQVAYDFDEGDMIYMTFTAWMFETIDSRITSLDTLKLDKTGGPLSWKVDLFEGANIASASTTNLATATGNTVHITGTTTINSFGTMQAGSIMNLIFDGALILTHNATTLDLPGNLDITTVAGDSMIIESKWAGNWKVLSYTKNDGQAIITANVASNVAFSTLYNVFWDGSDGNVTINSSTTTLTRDMYYNNLTVTSPGVLNPNGYKVYVKGTLSGNGTIRRNWNNGGNGNIGYGVAGGVGGAALNAGSLNADLWGANWGVSTNTGAGGIGTSANPSYTLINGTKGWNSNAGPQGGVGWTSTRWSLYNLIESYHTLWNFFHPASFALVTNQYKGPSASGGGGWNGTPNVGWSGGGAGGNGGMIWISALLMNFTWVMESKGGNWGNWVESSGYAGGGGSGGQGWVVYLISVTFTSIGTQTLTAWTGWSPGVGAVTGVSWNAGVTIQITIV